MMIALAALTLLADVALASPTPQAPRLAGGAQVVRPVATSAAPPFGRLGAAIPLRKRALGKPALPIS